MHWEGSAINGATQSTQSSCFMFRICELKLTIDTQKTFKKNSNSQQWAYDKWYNYQCTIRLPGRVVIAGYAALPAGGPVHVHCLKEQSGHWLPCPDKEEEYSDNCTVLFCDKFLHQFSKVHQPGGRAQARPPWPRSPSPCRTMTVMISP